MPGRPGFRCCKNVCLLTFENHNLSLFILFCCNLCCFDAIYAVLMHYMLFYCNMCYFIAIHAVFVCHFIAIYAVLSRRHDCCKIRAFPGTLGVVPRHFQLLLMSGGRRQSLDVLQWLCLLLTAPPLKSVVMDTGIILN